MTADVKAAIHLSIEVQQQLNKKDKAGPMVGVSALNFSNCFNMATWIKEYQQKT